MSPINIFNLTHVIIQELPNKFLEHISKGELRLKPLAVHKNELQNNEIHWQLKADVLEYFGKYINKWFGHNFWINFRGIGKGWDTYEMILNSHKDCNTRIKTDLKARTVKFMIMNTDLHQFHLLVIKSFANDSKQGIYL